jgi:hypothetical protein
MYQEPGYREWIFLFEYVALHFASVQVTTPVLSAMTTRKRTWREWTMPSSCQLRFGTPPSICWRSQDVSQSCSTQMSLLQGDKCDIGGGDLLLGPRMAPRMDIHLTQEVLPTLRRPLDKEQRPCELLSSPLSLRPGSIAFQSTGLGWSTSRMLSG